MLFVIQSLLPENHVLPKEAAAKYRGIVSFCTILAQIKETNLLRNNVKVFLGKVQGLILSRFKIQL